MPALSTAARPSPFDPLDRMPADEGRFAATRLFDAELEQCRQAEELALDWAERMNGGDPVEGAKATYAEVQLSEEQVAAAKRQKIQTELVRHLREADFLVHELIEIDGPAVSAALGVQAAAIHNLADEIEYGGKGAA